MKIQLVSDLHLEFGDITIDNNGADVLILSGDIVVAKDMINLDVWTQISNMRNFFRNVSSAFKHVVYIPGNHEYYKGDIDECNEYLKKECAKHDNVHFLENETVTIDGIVFVGGCLWTDCNKQEALTLHGLKNLMNDFFVISKNKKRFTPEDSVERHYKTLGYIREVLKNNMDRKCVVVSHHAPCHMSVHPMYLGETQMNGGFYSDLSEFILDHPQIVLWTHGHMHNSSDYMVGDTRIVCNPRGYSPKVVNKEFDPGKIIEI